jgi:hypothetical protein
VVGSDVAGSSFKSRNQPQGNNAMDPLLIPIVAILMPLVLVPTAMFLKHRHRRREWEHLERMKAMDFHVPMQSPRLAGKAADVTVIGAGVPAVSVVAAFLTTLIWEPSPEGDPMVPAIAWGCAVVISAGAMFTSLILAFMHGRATQRAEANTVMSNGKPMYEPDAFDVVSSRG